MSATFHLPFDALRAIRSTGLQQAYRSELTARPHPCSQPSFNLLFPQHAYIQKVLNASAMESDDPKLRDSLASVQYGGRETTLNDAASRSSCAPVQIGTKTVFPEAQHESTASYASPSEESEDGASNRPNSLNSVYSYALANEEEYVVEEVSDGEDEEWDDCETLSSDG